jgi:hypothetical protein
LFHPPPTHQPFNTSEEAEIDNEEDEIANDEDEIDSKEDEIASDEIDFDGDEEHLTNKKKKDHFLLVFCF